MGAALRRLEIPSRIVLTSATYRAVETVKLARLDRPQAVSGLDDGGQSRVFRRRKRRGSGAVSTKRPDLETRSA
jgi:hypothetical protein